MYTGPSLRNLGLSVVLHGAAIAGLMNLSLSAPPMEGRIQDVRPTEIRLSGKLYYVSRIEGSNDSARKSDPSKIVRRPGGIAAPRAAAAGQSRAPAPTPAPSSASSISHAEPSPAPNPEQIQALRQQARAFIPPEVRPKPTATQTIIQPLSPPDLVPPPTPLPNFRVFTDVTQMRKIPRPFQAPGRRTPPTPAQAPDVAAPALVLAPQAPAPVGDPLAVLALSDHPAPFNDKVVVPPGNIAQPPLVSTGPAGAPSGSAAANTAANGTGRAAGGTSSTVASAAASSASANVATATGAGNGSGPAAGNGRAAVGNGTGSALAGASRDGNPGVVVGGNGATSGGAGSPAGIGANAASLGASSSRGGIGTAAGAERTAPGSPTINRPPTGTFDAVVVQSSPVDQYPESRGLLSGRPIYSVYIPMGSARDWTLFFCVPGEKPDSGNGPVVVLGPMGAPVKAPYPTKLIKPIITLPSYEKYVLVHGTVNKDGKFESLRLVRPVKPETDQALLAALAAWEFRAATRDGTAIVVEFLLSIPAKGL